MDLPISCFLNEASDSLGGILDLWSENVWLAAKGGGIGSYWGNLRSIGEKIGKVGKTSGIIPFIKVMDSLTMAISQGSLRRGSAACYLPIDHPEIEEFMEMRELKEITLNQNFTKGNGNEKQIKDFDKVYKIDKNILSKIFGIFLIIVSIRSFFEYLSIN